MLPIQSASSCFSFSFGSSLAAASRPALENALVFISFSHALNRSICCAGRSLEGSK